MAVRIGFWTTFTVTLALYAAIVVWSAPLISAEAGGRAIFDLRPTGYTVAEAHSFLQALSPEGSAFYRDVQLRLDLFYPVLLSFTTCWALLWLLPARRWRPVALLAPVLAMAFDYAENFLIHRMLAAGADGLTPDLVAWASLFSQLKAAFSTVSLTLLLVVIALWAHRRFRRSGRAGPTALH